MMMRFRNGLNASDSLFNYITLITELAGLPTQALSSFFGQNADNNGAAVVPMETKQILNQTLAGLNITTAVCIWHGITLYHWEQQLQHWRWE